MENNNQKIFTWVGAVIIALLLIGFFFALTTNIKNKKNLKAEKLTSELLLSEKLSFEKDLEKIKAEFSALKTKNEATAKLLAETNRKIAEKDNKINSLTATNKSLSTVKKELEDLQKFKSELEKESAQLKSDYNKLLLQNQDLQKRISLLEEDKKALALQLEESRSYCPDNYLVKATRGKKTEKIVISASRAKKLNLLFEVPGNLAEEISFKIITPSGTIINPDDKGLTWYFPQDSRYLTASLSPVTGDFEQSRQVVLTYLSKTKLTKGEYKIQIFGDEKNVGNCRILLK